jgi:hypothetical protein
MKHEDLIGKTISGIMAVPVGDDDGPLKIWMLKFTDGTHVEFVSPGARRGLDRLARRKSAARRNHSNGVSADPQLALNVA